MDTNSDEPSGVEPMDSSNLPDEIKRSMTKKLFKDRYDEEREYFKDFFEYRFKAVNYLLVAHAGALVGCLGALKGYNDTPFIKGIGIFMLVFAVGFVIASFGFLGLLMAKNKIMNLIIDGAASERPDMKQISLAYSALGISYVLLIGGVLGIAAQLSAL
jgi:hypothetical protein